MRFPSTHALAALSLCLRFASAVGPPVFFFTRFPTSSRQLRDELVRRMDNISHWSCENEPGVSKYALVVPREDDGTTAWSIEQYEDDATFNQHLAARPVQEGLFAWSTSVRNLWAPSPSVQNFTVLESLNFVKPEFLNIKDPYLAIEAVSYQAGTVGRTLEYWRDVVSASWNETGTLAFGVYGDPEDQNKLYALAAYESLEFRTNIHAKSEAALALEANTKDLRVSVDRTLLEKRGGFLYKSGTTCG